MSKQNSLVNQIKGADELSRVYEILFDNRGFTPTSRESIAISNKISELADKFDIKVGLLGNFTLDLLPPFLTAALAEIGLSSDSYIAAYNQYYQEILDETSDLHRFEPDIVILCLDVRELSPEIFFRFAEIGSNQREQMAREMIDHVLEWLKIARQKLASNILICNFIPPTASQLGIADNTQDESQTEYFNRLNTEIRKSINQYEQAYLVDIAQLGLQIGWGKVFDAKMYYLAKVLWSDDFMWGASRLVARYTYALRALTKKCLVLDLDNTIWGGVLGEDGVQGVKIGAGDPIGEAYHDFQCKIKSLKQRGIILAICSKNNLLDVEEIFSVRTDMPLKLDDFAAVRINWEMKHQNMSELAAELNIGLDSLVFIDDNPAEINLVQELLPEVTSLLLPKAHEMIPGFLDGLPYFEKLFVLDSDREKTRQYMDNRKRNEQKFSASNLESYLQGLGTRVLLRKVETDDVQRIHQLFTKTNQFNLTTIRYSIDDILRFIEDNAHDLYCFSVEDRFGSLGIVGVLLIVKREEFIDIDSFILSCRAMGRSVEVAIMNWVKDYYLFTQKYAGIKAKFIPTQKNQPVVNLYPDQGFDPIAEEDDKYSYYLDSSSVNLLDCNWINLDTEV